jgi:hypothetical protein
MDLLSERGAHLAYYDPYVPVIKPTREYSHWAGKKSVEWNRATIESFDAVLIATNHSWVNYQELADWARCMWTRETPWQRACCAGKSVESIGTHKRNEVTTTQGFSLVFTARPHMSFTVWLIGFFFTLGLAYLFQKILGTSYWRSWRSLSSGHWFSGTCLDEC